MMNRIRLSPLVASFGVAVIMALLLSGSAGASSGTSISQPQSSSASAQQEVQPGDSTAFAQPPLCRYGVTASGAAQSSWLPTWRIGWTLDFGAHTPVQGLAAEFAQLISVRQDRTCFTYYDGYSTLPALTEADLGAVIKSAPGSLWLVGNEPDRGPNVVPGNCNVGAQDAAQPEMYARIYHDVYAFIKQRDPSARVANAGLVEMTPGRLQYLDRVWQEYQRRYGRPMPVDVWNMHLYVMPEADPYGQSNNIAGIAVGTDPSLAMLEGSGDANRCSDPQVYCIAEHDDVSIFAQQVTAMRTWMKQHGQQDKPLIISEYSQLYPYKKDPGYPPPGCWVPDEYKNCFTPERVSTFMKNSFSYLEGAVDLALGYPMDGYRLVQRWMWFSTNNSGPGEASNLVVNTLDQQTLVGATFQSEAASRVSSVNLLPGHIRGSAGHAGGPGQTASVQLTAEVFNNGSVANTTPVKATFYANSGLTQVIGAVTISGAINGCASRSVQVDTIWADLSIGAHPFWVKVDSDNAVSETNEADNVGTGVVYVFGRDLYLPTLSR